MIEVIKNIAAGLMIGVTGVFAFLLVMWVLLNAPAWLIGTTIGLGFAWCLGRLVRGESF